MSIRVSLRISSRISSAGCLLLLAVLSPSGLAQTLYKSTMPDGKVIYGDKPTPGAVKVDESRPDTSKQGVAPPVKREAATATQLEKERMARESAGSKVQAAEKALRDAEAALVAGKESREGERLGTVSGNQRLTDAYWDRQKSLEQAVEQARRNLEQARTAK